MPPSRRDFLAAALSAAALPLLGACDSPGAAPGDRDPLPPPGPGTPPPASDTGLFRHGVASGDPLADRVILWTRLSPAAEGPVTVRWRVWADPGLQQLVREGSTQTDASRDYTVKLDADGLEAGRSYYFRFEAPTASGASAHSPVGRTRTAPRGAAAHLRIALVTCSNYASGYFTAYRKLADRADLDLVLHLGDYLYETGNASGERADPMPGEMTTLPQYRSRHATTKTDADLQELHRQHPMICIWDDHEFTNDAHENGAQNHTEGAEGTWSERKAWAKQAYFEWLPVREQPGTSGRLYRAFAYGELMDLVMLDGRVEGRSPQVASAYDPARSDESRSMLGAEQEAWLADRLRTSTATWKLLGNQTMLGHLNESIGLGPLRLPVNNWMDQWDGYPPARQRLFELLKGDASHPKIDNVVVCTGDWHNSFVMDLPEDPASGYDPATGSGSLAVEYVTPSVTSGFFGVDEAGLAQFSPHIKHHNDAMHGYQLLDITPQRVIGEEWQVSTISERSSTETRAVAFETLAGGNRLRPYGGGPTPSKPDAPSPAPDY